MAAPFVIVGAGQAGASAAAKLRALGFDGEIVLLGAEAVPPYQRPPLSKKYVSGELAFDRLLIRPVTWYDEQRITLRLSTEVRSLDAAAKALRLSDGTTIAFDKLLLATGSRPRRLPAAIGGELKNVFTVRDLADADGFAPLLTEGRRLLVVGGGYIGLEGAAVAAKKGLHVTVLEAADRILQRVAAPLTSDYFRALHQRHGVTIREAMGLSALLGQDGRVVGARLADGSDLACDLAIVGIGILPNEELARDAGLKTDAGIWVDGSCRTSHTDIFAAGDCANFLWRGQRTRLESVQNAIDQAEHAAAAMLGATGDYDPKPWFWSDQYDVKLQIAGLNRGYDQVVLRPGKRDGSQSVWYFKGADLLALDAMNDALSYAFGKKILEARRPLTPAQAADPTIDLKALST